MHTYKTIDAENTFTDWKLFSKNQTVDISISGVSDSTVTLQRKFKEYTTDILDVDTWTEDTEKYFVSASTTWYRIGVKTGDYGTDTIKVRLVV